MTRDRAPRVVIVGGGIAGLAAARRLADHVPVTQFEAAERLGGKLAPLWLDGVYAGGAGELSFDAVAPGLIERARAGGSLLGHAHAGARREAEGPIFAGLSGGVSTLVDALVDDLGRRGVDISCSSPVRRLD